MQIVGFNYTKIQAENINDLKSQLSTINTNVEFTNLEKEKIEAIKEKEVLKINFHFSIKYNVSEENKEKTSEITFEGHLLLMTERDESKEILKTWKKKQLPTTLRLFLINNIIKKCATRAQLLAEELLLPPPFPIPQVSPQKTQQ